MQLGDTIMEYVPYCQMDAQALQVDMPEVNVGIPFDSIFRVGEEVECLSRPSLFEQHTLTVKHDELMSRPPVSEPVWMFGLLLVLGVLLFVYYRLRKLHISELLGALVDRRAEDRLVRANNLTTSRLAPIGLLVTATVAIVVQYVALQQTGVGEWLLLSAGLAMLYLLRNAVIRLMGGVFEDKEPVLAYITNGYLCHLMLSTTVIPLLFLLIYMPMGQQVVLYVIYALVAFCFLIRLLRGMYLFLIFSKSHSFYLFYYLCTIEIVPVLVLTKWLLNQ